MKVVKYSTPAYLINSTLNASLKPTQLKPIKIAQKSSSKRKLKLLIKTAIIIVWYGYQTCYYL